MAMAYGRERAQYATRAHWLCMAHAYGTKREREGTIGMGSVATTRGARNEESCTTGLLTREKNKERYVSVKRGNTGNIVP